ncbi:transcriptional regulator domain-containing protein [Pinisolibacter aquiterrae]|uniref:transcriptional regulator domain-containing protein n=1 Tax=Pinisolibacter aquiterrae TaxID=2815579 RepID=UPI003B75D344
MTTFNTQLHHARGHDRRSDAAYDYLKALDPFDMAWEFLRRNPAYRREHAELCRAGQPVGARADLLVRCWGLRFPDRSGARCDRDSCLLASR